ncbi:DsbA family protein [Streptomyces sp. NPDC058052]|uniref:DsbA family protein n=1 Tax=Streptomyces sp. NPDC058052 TaxID=3346316 RepID=UPI0036E27510
MKKDRAAGAAAMVVLVGVLAGCAGGRSADGPAEAGDPGPAATAAAPAAAAARWTSTASLPERLAADGTTIVVGDPGARSTVRVLEDPRCPVVEEFERTGAPGLRSGLLSRMVKAEYTFASFKDDRLGGDGSKRAVNALRAALEQGKFVEYHAVLFRHQAEVESSGGFTTERLLQLAAKVPRLRGDAFDTAVRTMRYRAFVTASERAYETTGDDPRGPGTPSVVVNGHPVEGGLYHLLFDEEAVKGLVFDLHYFPARWEKSYLPYKAEVEAEMEAGAEAEGAAS